MKKAFDEFWNQLVTVKEELDNFQENGNLSSLSSQKLKPFLSAWNKLHKLASVLDDYITPVDPIEVKIPFHSDDFLKMWTRWKNYLSEQHGQTMGNYSEVAALEYLVLISKSDEKKAIYILLYAQTCRYKNFFEIDEKAAKQPAKEEPSGRKSAYD